MIPNPWTLIKTESTIPAKTFESQFCFPFDSALFVQRCKVAENRLPLAASWTVATFYRPTPRRGKHFHHQAATVCTQNEGNKTTHFQAVVSVPGEQHTKQHGVRLRGKILRTPEPSFLVTGVGCIDSIDDILERVKQTKYVSFILAEPEATVK